MNVRGARLAFQAAIERRAQSRIATIIERRHRLDAEYEVKSIIGAWYCRSPRHHPAGAPETSYLCR